MRVLAVSVLGLNRHVPLMDDHLSKVLVLSNFFGAVDCIRFRVVCAQCPGSVLFLNLPTAVGIGCHMISFALRHLHAS